ncbi:MAG: hypothetical protein GY765_06460, partial [bacterium]|nr:hypothetical protein [bacterium]
IDDKNAYESLGDDSSTSNIVWLATKQSGYDLWSGFTGGFLSRQDVRQEKWESGAITDQEYFKGMSIDVGISIGSQFIGGAVAGKIGGRIAGYTGSKFVGSAIGEGVSSGFESLIQQSGQVFTHLSTEGRIGQEKISFKQAALSTGTGAVFSGAMYGAQKAAVSEFGERLFQGTKAGFSALKKQGVK